MEPRPDPPIVRVVVVETAIAGVHLGRLPLLLPEPADVEVGWTTADDGAGQW